MAKSPRLSDFQILQILPEPGIPGPFIQQIKKYFDDKGIRVCYSHVYAIIGNLHRKNLVEIRRAHTQRRLCGNRDVLTPCLTEKGVVVWNMLREKYRRENGEYPPKVNILEGEKKRDEVNDNQFSMSTFLSKYKA